MVSDMTVRIRKPAVAGTFYPAKADALHAEIDRCWADRRPVQAPAPKAIIAPHAGYVYSGPVAATAYATLVPLKGSISRVVLVGPSHRFALYGFAVPEAQIWQTPIGMVPLDTASAEQLEAWPDVTRSDLMHGREHSLEVHVPFLQRALGKFSLLPVLVGHTPANRVAALFAHVWGGPETLVVVSTDLSHYHAQAKARQLDDATIAHVVAFDAAALNPDHACGAYPVAGLLTHAQCLGMRIQAVDVRTSADTAGDPDRVVGYASFLLW
ncbi:MAG: AmmeMemoRadiSam system protein B [Deltaproteobacteria bacterium]|nr:AmmeMemoRadiSam system protein B [Deltaproteobacteria bacterium]